MTSFCLNCEKSFKVGRTTYGKYCCNKCQIDYECRKRFLRWKSGEYTPTQSSIRTILHKYEPNKCAICGISGTWNGSPMKFICDHIDGNSENNTYENLRKVCHNCDSQLPTYKGRNKGKGRHARRLRYQEGKSY